MKENKDKVLDRHVYVFNPDDNGGESLILTTTFIDNGDEVPVINQELGLQSYCNAATFTLVGANLTPCRLRELADQLENAKIRCINKMRKKKKI